MQITIEQARVLEAVARLGTIQKAAEELHRGHSAIIYSLKNLEDQTNLKLFQRIGQRNHLTIEGDLALKHCRRLLDAHQSFEEACTLIKGGWEPSFKLIYDEVVDFNIIGQTLFQLNKLKAPTEVKVLSAHLGEVEKRFTDERADIMVTILPLQRLQIPSRKLRPIHMHLVAHREHPLGHPGRQKLQPQDLNKHTFVTILNSRGQVGLGTEQTAFDSYFFVNSFTQKKQALLHRLGFGWLPDYLIRAELKKGTLRLLPTEMDNTHTLHPRLYHRPKEQLGRVAQEVLSCMDRFD